MQDLTGASRRRPWGPAPGRTLPSGRRGTADRPGCPGQAAGGRDAEVAH